MEHAARWNTEESKIGNELRRRRRVRLESYRPVGIVLGDVEDDVGRGGGQDWKRTSEEGSRNVTERQILIWRKDSEKSLGQDVLARRVFFDELSLELCD